MFEECWKLYGRKGNKRISLRYWKKLSTSEKLAVLKAIPAYCGSRERQYRKDFQGWINPTNRMWEDEIIKEEKERIILK